MKNRILVVEDERIISDLICMNLEAAGYETRAVYDGSEAAGLLLCADGTVSGKTHSGDLPDGKGRRDVQGAGAEAGGGGLYCQAL